MENPILDGAMSSIIAGRNTVITGVAGGGKSTLINTLVTFLADSLVLTGTTGLAAINIGGMTAHGALSIPVGIPDESSLKRPLRKGVGKLFNKTSPVKTLIIDEAGMLTSAHFWYIDKRLQKIRKNSQPFGGIQVVLVGDILQLPPVVKREELPIYDKFYGGVSYFSYKDFQKFDFYVYSLEKVYRQDNIDFVNILNRIRTGSHTQADLDRLNKRVRKPFSDSTILCTTNARVDYINNLQLDKLKTKQKIFKAVHSGYKPNEYPLPENIKLKLDCRVIICSNHYPVDEESEVRYINGDSGVVKDFTSDGGCVVKLDKNSDVVIINPQVKTKKESYVCPLGTLKSRDIGSFEQLPIRVAYCLSVHKSQGMTLQKVHLDLGTNVFASGMTYVGLSRVVCPQGLTLERPITNRDILIDKKALDFVNQYANLDV